MKSATRSWIVICIACMSAASWAQTPSGDVLKHVPDDAGLALVVPSLDKFGAAFASFVGALDVPMMPKLEAETVIESILGESFGHSEGLDTAGTFVAAFVPSDDPKPVMICRLKDAAAWKANAEPAEEGGLLKVIVQGDDWLASIKDDVLILCSDAAVIKAALSAKGKFSEMLKSRSGGLFKEHQAVFLADVPAWKDQIDQGLMMADAMIKMGMMMSAGPQAQSGVQIWEWASKEFKSLVEQTRTVAAGLRFGADGIHLDDFLTVSPDGKLATYLTGVRKSEGHLLRGIASGSFAVAFGTEWEAPEGSGSVFGGLMKAMMKSATADESADHSKIEAGLKKTLAVFGSISGYSGALAPVRDEEGMLISGAYFCENPTRTMGDMESLIKQKELMAAFSMGVTVDTKLREEKIDGHAVKIFDYTFESDDPELAQAMQSAYGGSPSLYLAVQGKQLVYVMGPSGAARARMAKTLSGKSGGLTANTRVTKALGSIPPSPQLIGLLDLSGFVGWTMKMAASSGAPVPPIELGPSHAPLVAFGGYLDKSAVRASLFIPTEALREVLNAMNPDGNPDAAD